MWINTLWHRWYGRSRPLPSSLLRRRSARQRPSFRPQLEALEYRLAPATFQVTTTGEPTGTVNLTTGVDSGTGHVTLRGAIEAVDNLGGSNTIHVPTGTYLLTQGEFDITDTITIIGKSATIERNSTATAFRLFDVQSGASLTLESLTLKNGLAQGSGAAAAGGAIYSSGTLTLQKVTVAANQAQGNNGTQVQNNSSGSNATDAAGGGVFVAAGKAAFANDTFSYNSAVGGKGGQGYSSSGGGGGTSGWNITYNSGGGGALYAAGSTLTLTQNSIEAALAQVHGDAGGRGFGGGLYVEDGAVTLTQDTFLGDSAKGNSGGSGIGSNGGTGGNGYGGGLFAAGGTVTLRNDSLLNNRALGGEGGFGNPSGEGGKGFGGGMVVSGSDVNLTSNELGSNSAIGGTGGLGATGGNGHGGGLLVANGTVTVNGDTFHANYAQGGIGGHGMPEGGAGGNGGNGSGGGLTVKNGSVALSNNTFFANIAQGGAGGMGGQGAFSYQVGSDGGDGGDGGTGSGGGLNVEAGSVNLVNDTLTHNQGRGGGGGAGGDTGYGIDGYGSPGSPGTYGTGIGGGLKIGGGSVTLANTLIAENTADSALDVSGTVSSSDYDLIGNGAGSNLSNGDSGSDLVGYTATALKLGSLGNNDGSRVGAAGDRYVLPTVALLAGSPAIDAGDDSAAPGATDQRGYARIAGFAIDIGAYEYGATPAASNLFVSGNAAYGTAPGGEIVYNLTVKNLSSTAQSNVTLADVLPADTTLVSWMPAVGDWSQSAWNHDAPAIGDSGTVTAWIGSLPGKTSAAFTLIVQVNGSTPKGTIITDTASVGPITGDPKPGNNSTTFHTAVTAGTIISSGIQVSGGKISPDNTTGLWVQKVTIKNSSDISLLGSLALELTNLRSAVTLVNADGIAPNGDPYIDFLAPGHSLAPGQSITLTLEFAAPTAASIKGYGSEVMHGL